MQAVKGVQAGKIRVREVQGTVQVQTVSLAQREVWVSTRKVREVQGTIRG